MAWLSTFTTELWFSLALIFLPLLFPDGRLPSPRWRPVLWLGVARLALGAVGTAFAPGRARAAAELRDSTIRSASRAVCPRSRTRASLSSGALAVVLAAASIVVRLRRARGAERQQLKWFAYVGVLAARPVPHRGRHRLGLRRVDRRFHRGGGDGLAQRARARSPSACRPPPGSRSCATASTTSTS